jgi:CRISPR-associated protein Cas1
MSNGLAGAPKAELHELPQMKKRLTFLYLEHCKIHREDSAIKVTDAEGIFLIPSAVISVLLLGPGTTITHRAIELISDTGVSLVWVGEEGVRYYASGRPLTKSSRLLMKQAELVSTQRKHLQVVKKMYSLRFPGENLTSLTMQQLRGREGYRMRAIYTQQARRWGVKWEGRKYEVDDFYSSDPVNMSLTSGNICLYGLAHSVIAALGCSPGLGFVHVGHEKSFVYDIADLYKAEISIPLAFELASKGVIDIEKETRKEIRKRLYESHILERMVKDIHFLLDEENEIFDDETDDTVYLWTNVGAFTSSGVNY